MKVKANISDNSEALEIIELAIDDLETLTKAFNMISRVCEEMNNPHIDFSDDVESGLIN